MNASLDFSLERSVSTEEFRDLLVRSTLGERRPVGDAECLEGMLNHADILATCWLGDRLVGVARSITDFHYCCYLSDLAVDLDSQKQGMGTALISLTRTRLRPTCKLILLSAPAATGYYPHIGFDPHPSAWVLAGDRGLRS